MSYRLQNLRSHTNIDLEEVPTPTDVGLNYEGRELVTPDGVKLRCYLLTQKKDLSLLGGPAIDSPEQSDEEVCPSYLRERCCPVSLSPAFPSPPSVVLRL